MNFPKEPLRVLLKLFAAEKIEYAVLGGLAVVLYGEPRLTMDIDVNILLDDEKIDSFLSAAKTNGFSLNAGRSKLSVKKTGVIPLEFTKGRSTVAYDLIIAQSDLENVCIKRAIKRKIGHLEVKFVSPEDLVIHKLASNRPKDLEDLRGVLIRQKGKLDLAYIFLWLKKIDQANPGSTLVSLFKSLFHNINGE
jgi:predicted nucleotidyltransferase